jgi:hypothetical protein
MVYDEVLRRMGRSTTPSLTRQVFSVEGDTLKQDVRGSPGILGHEWAHLKVEELLEAQFPLLALDPSRDCHADQFVETDRLDMRRLA